LFVVGAFCERPRATTGRPYMFYEKSIYCGIAFFLPQGVLSTRKVRFLYEKIPFLRKKVIDLGGKLRYNMLA